MCACSDGALRVVDPFAGAVTHTVAGDPVARSEEIAAGVSVEPRGRYANMGLEGMSVYPYYRIWLFSPCLFACSVPPTSCCVISPMSLSL